jgi:LysR family transcriptional regulator, transcriptional activator of nhaA
MEPQKLIYNVNMPLDLNYHHLYYFWVCVRSGSLTAAARELHLSQSALSLQLKSLERALGRRLLDRSRSGVVPTADGRLVFERCERIFPEGESLAAMLRSGGSAPIDFRVGFAGGLGRELIFDALDALAPIKNLKPSVVVSPGEEILANLSRRRLDAGFFSADVAAQLGPSFRSTRLDAMPAVFVAAPALVRAMGPFPRRGSEYPMLLRPAEHPIRRKVDAWLAEQGLRAQIVAETADVDLMLSLALRGRGIAVLRMGLIKADLAAKRLVRLPGSPDDILHEIWAAVPVHPPADLEARQAVAAIMGMAPVSKRRA